VEPETGEMLRCINGQVDRMCPSYHLWLAGYCHRKVEILSYFLLLPRTSFISSDLILTKYYFQSFTTTYSNFSGFVIRILGAKFDVTKFVYLTMHR